MSQRSNSKNEIHLDPVPAYDRLAAEFGSLSDKRRAYLAGIEKLVIAEIPPGTESLLDVGAGDGRRALRIAEVAGVKRLVLLDPSVEMRKLWPAGVEGWGIRAEELGGGSDIFDVITCLWNVLGHIFPDASRIQVLRHCARLLSPEGLLFVDVNYRYNVRHYGVLPTAVRMLRDRLRPSEENGNVTVRWNVDGTTYATAGHVFTESEFCRDVSLAGLTIEKRFTVDYATGAVRRWRFAGNRLYLLRQRRR